MNPNLERSLKEYIQDTVEFHGKYHSGDIEQCRETGCRFAMGLRDGYVRPEIYRDIISGGTRDADC